MEIMEKQFAGQSRAQAAKWAGTEIGCEYHELTSITNIEGQLMGRYSVKN